MLPSPAAMHLGDTGRNLDPIAIKNRQSETWSSGDYSVFGTTLQIVGEDMCEALDIRSGQSVLEVAAGHGNASLAAARRFCDVVATDYVPALLQRARERAAAERLIIECRVADAEALPFGNGAFDVVLSTFGVMFAPDQDRAAAELIRVCRPGGKIGLANWTPHGFVGQLLETIGKHRPPPAAVESPVLWGTRGGIAALFSDRARLIAPASRHFTFRYRTPEHWIDVFKNTCGPWMRPFDGLDTASRQALDEDLLTLIGRFNCAADGSMVVPSEYLEVVIGLK